MLKEIKLRPRIAINDFNTKLRAVRKLLAKDRVRVSVIFRGREVTHPSIGVDLLDRMVDGTKDIARVESRHQSDYTFSIVLIRDDKAAAQAVLTRVGQS